MALKIPDSCADPADLETINSETRLGLKRQVQAEFRFRGGLRQQRGTCTECN